MFGYGCYYTSSGNQYTLSSNDTTDGKIYLKAPSTISGDVLASAIQNSPYGYSSFSITTANAGYTDTANLGKSGQGTFTIFGNGFSINGNSYYGLYASNQAVVDIFNVGSSTSTTDTLGNVTGVTINNSINGFYKAGSSGASGSNLGYGGFLDAEGYAGSANSATYQNVVYDKATPVDTNFYHFIYDSVFYQNSAVNGGGALYIDKGAVVNIYNSVFSNNGIKSGATVTALGGAILNGYTSGDFRSGYCYVADSIFYQNSAINGGGAIANASHSGESYLTINNSALSYNNAVVTSGTAPIAEGGALFNFANSSRTNSVISNTSFYNNCATATNLTSSSTITSQALGGAIYDYANDAKTIVTLSNSTFTNNYAQATSSADSNASALASGGVIYNYGTEGPAAVTIFNSTLNNNYASATSTSASATALGGAIYNFGYKTTNYLDTFNEAELTISNSSITGNTATATSTNVAAKAYGGAIYNSGDGDATTLGQHTFLTVSNSNFTNNYASATTTSGTADSAGGAIYNYGSAAVATIKGSTFTGNGKDSTGTVFTQNGGAIYNDAGAALTIANTSFIGNAATTNGGAIYNGAGTTTYIQADNATTLFQNNTANLVSNAIYMAGTDNSSNASNLYLNAGNSGIITVDDGIKGTNSLYNNIYINSSNATASTSIINSSNTLTNGTVNLYGDIAGATIYNYAGNTNFGAAMTNSALTISGGTFNLTSAGSISNTALTLNAGTFNMANGTIDTISVTNFTASESANLGFDVNLDTGTNDKIAVSGKATGTLSPIINIIKDVIFNGSRTVTLITGSDISGLTLKDTIVIFTLSEIYKFTGANDGTYTVSMQEGSNLNQAVAIDTLATRTFSATGDASALYALGAMGKDGSTLYIVGNNHNILGHGFAGIGVNAGQTLSITGVGSIANGTSWNGFASTNGGAINNSGTTTIDNSIFSTNYATANGGVLYNSGSSTVTNATFTGNGKNSSDTVLTQNGGAIYNTNTLKIANTSFTNNTATTNGGAIYNAAGATAYVQADGVGKQTLFQGNTANSASNAIYMAGISGSTSNLYLNAGNSGTITIEDAIAGAGASYNNIYVNSSDTTASTSLINPSNTLTTGTVNIYGDITENTVNVASGTTNFGVTNSTSTGYYNGTAFNLSGGTQNFNNGITNSTITSSGGDQTFNNVIASSTISASSGTQTFNNGITGTTITSTGGTQTLNSSISGNSTLNVSGGTFNLANAGSISNTTLNLNSGTFDMSANGKTDTLSINNFTANAAGTLKFDADLAGGTNDKITVAGTASGTLNSSINITKDALINGDSTLTLLTGSNISGLSLGSVATTTYTTYGRYTFVGGSTPGTYNVSMDWLHGLNSAVAVDTLDSRSFSATDNTVAFGNLGTLGKANSTLNILGHNFSINGLGDSGIGVNAGQTLSITGVGSIANGTSWNGFASTNGGAINNSGTTTIDNSIFSTNYATANGGVLYNSGSSTVSTVTNSTFTGNGKNSSDTVLTQNGGAIYNTNTLKIANTSFTNNTATTNGGAIYNAAGATAYIQADGTGKQTLFQGNTANSASNAIYMAGISGSTSNLYLNSGNSGTITIDDAIAGAGASYNNIYVNSSDTTASTSIINPSNTLTNGTVDFKSDVSNLTMNVAGGTTNFGNVIIPNVNEDNVAFNITGGNQTFTNATFKNGSRININNAGTTTDIVGSTFNGTSVTGSGGAINNTTGRINISSSTFSNYTSSANGGAINNGTSGITNITNSSFTNNTASGNGGAIYNGGIVNIVADGANTTFANNRANGTNNDIYLASGSKLNLNAASNNKISFAGGVTGDSGATTCPIINVNGTSVNDNSITSTAKDGEVVFNGAVRNSTVNLYNGILTLGADSYLNGNSLTLAGGTLNMQNGAVGSMLLNSLAVTGSTNLAIDVDLYNAKTDTINIALNGSPTSGSGTLNISSIKLISDSNPNAKGSTTTNLITNDSELAKLIRLNVQSVNGTNAYTPIYKYNVSYDNNGSLSFKGGPTTGGGGGNYQAFNPAILASSVSANLGAYMSQANIYSEVLTRSDNFMSLPYADRMLMRYNNKSASIGGVDAQPEVFSPTYMPEEKGGLWFKEYTTFENVPLINGPNVSNIGYGSIIGADSPMMHFRNGFDGYFSAYTAYNGSHQNYDQVGVNQNGGALGLTAAFYKGNFFTALTASVGDTYGQANTMYGVDNFNTLLAGLAWKTGYNFEIKKFILQPTFLASYTFAKTFDYQTASGANINDDPLNALQIAPGAKLIYNARDGWQPYLAMNMVWNIMDVQKFYANDVPLPEMSIAPYFEYGVGVQRLWGGRFSGFGQCMFRGGGINGLALLLGFRLSIGK